VVNEFLALAVVAACWPSDQNVEVSDRFPSAPQRARWRDLFDAAKVLQVLDYFFGLNLRRIQQKSPGNPSVVLDRLQ